MIPRIKNILLASADQVAVDAIAVQLMGFDPLSLPYLRMCHERELGVADPAHIRVMGEDISDLRTSASARGAAWSSGAINSFARACFVRSRNFCFTRLSWFGRL